MTSNTNNGSSRDALMGNLSARRRGGPDGGSQSSTNYDDFDFDALGHRLGIGGDDGGGEGGYQPGQNQRAVSDNTSTLAYLSNMKKMQRTLRGEKMRQARSNIRGSMILNMRSESSNEHGAPRERRSFFQVMSDRTPLVVSVAVVFVESSGELGKILTTVSSSSSSCIMYWWSHI